jgi:hypothetical protein
MFINLNAVVVPEKRHEQQAEHVERRDEGCDQPDYPVNPARLIGLPENLVLAPKACKWRDSGDGECCDQHGSKRPRNVDAQAAHFAHVLLAAD